MLVNIYIKFHEGILNGFWVTERTQPYRKIYCFQFQRAVTPKIHNLELRFLRSALCLMLLYICVKFHENISRFWSYRADTILWQTDRRPGQDVSQPYRGRHKYIFSSLALLARYLYICMIMWYVLHSSLATKLKTYMYVCYNLNTFTGTLMLAYPF